MDIKELLNSADADINVTISELMSKRHLRLPDVKKSELQLDAKQHKVFDKFSRPDKKVKIDIEDNTAENTTVVTSGSNTSEGGFKYEPVARIGLALQKLIVKRAVSFLFGNPVGLDADPETDNEMAVLKALKKIKFDVKEKSFNRKVARNLFEFTEVAEVWYPEESQNTMYGFDSKFKLRCSVFSPFRGDMLYPYFDERWNMIAFSRHFTIQTASLISKSYFETYTDEYHYMWELTNGGYAQCEGYPKQNIIGKIPVVFGHQWHTEWHDVQELIERLEKLLSNFADTNDYHASPKIFIKGNLQGFAKKGEAGAILQGDENSSAEYLSWANAPESVKLEIDTLLRMIYTITQTPDISFDSVKGINVSGVALKLMFMDAHLKVADHQEVFDEYLQRRINIQKAFIGKFNTKLEVDAENLFVEPVITPYMIVDEVAEIKIWTEANGGNPVMSQKASFEKAGLTHDSEADFNQYLAEQSGKNSFTLNEPTLPA